MTENSSSQIQFNKKLVISREKKPASACSCSFYSFVMNENMSVKQNSTKIVVSMISRENMQAFIKGVFFFTACGKSQCGKMTKFFPSNQLFTDLFSKCVVFTKFLPKKRESKFPYFPHFCWENEHFFSSNELLSNLYSKCVVFTKFLPKKRKSKFP